MAPIQWYATSYNSDIICLSESFFDSSVGTNNPQINIPCYNIFCCDPPSDTEIGGVWRESTNSYTWRSAHFSKCIVIVNTGTKFPFFSVSFTCTWLSNSNFWWIWDLLLRLGFNTSKYRWLFTLLSIDDFNAKNRNWWFEETVPNYVILVVGYSLLINKPSHFLNGTTSCIGLIFCINPAMINDSGIHHSLYHSCH